MKTLVFVIAVFAAVSARRLFHGDQVLRINPKTKLDLDAITRLEDRFPSIDFWSDAHGSRPVDIHVSREDLPAMKALLGYSRLEYEIFIDDLQVALDNQISPRAQQMSLDNFDYNVYHTLDEINQWIDDMAATYSSVTKITYGTSYEGRPINALKISSGGLNKPAYVIDCGLHAREWVSPATCLYTAKYFVEAGVGSEEYAILQNMDIYITPVGNPDGYVYTWTTDRMWRKTRSEQTSRCSGVDPNRNWDINWSGPGADSFCQSDAFYGPSAMSEIEVSSKSDFIAGIPNVQAYIDIHAYSQYWMYPYAYTYSFCSDDTILRKIAEDSVNAIKSVHGETYQYGPISEVIYQASGSTTDYMYEKLNIKCAFAAELRDTGRYGFTLPERFIQPTAEENFAGLKVIASNVSNGICS